MTKVIDNDDALAMVEVGAEEVIGERLAHWARTTPDKRFIKCGGDWLTYRETHELTDRVSAGLQAIGVGKGHHVAFLISNRPEFVGLFLACARVGSVQVPVNPFLRGEFLRYQLDDSEAEVLITDNDGYELSKSFFADLPHLRQLILVGEITADLTGLSVPVTTYEEVVSATGDVKLPALGAGDLVSILYTSGTTGKSKGCLMTHGYYLSIARELAAAGLMRQDDTQLTPCQLFHTSGQVYNAVTALDAGASVVLDPWFSASALMDRAREEGATMLHLPGAMSTALSKQPPRANDKDHKIRIVFGVPVPPDLQIVLKERFGFGICAETYGQTEANIPSITGPFDEKRDGTSGKVTPYFDVRTVDDDDIDVPVGEVGEIILRPRLRYGMYSGYWKKPQETMEAWRNLWHHTGDNGRLDADGYLTFVDRKKDSLRRRGENVSSLELEQAILLHPGIAGVACHAIPSELGEDEIKACIVATPGTVFTPEELFAFFKKSLPYFAIPKYVEILDELPLSAMARVQKYSLIERGITENTWDLEALGLTVDRSERRSV